MKNILLLLLSVWSLQTYAQTGMDVVFKQSKAADMVVGLDNLDKIVFQEDRMVCFLNDGTDRSIDLDSFLGFLLTSPTGSNQIEPDAGEICYADGCLTVNGHRNEIVKIYCMDTLVKEMAVEWESQSFDLSDLQQGIYIAVIGTQVIKLAK